MCSRCQRVKAIISRAEAVLAKLPCNSRSDYFREYYRQNKDKKLADAKARYHAQKMRRNAA